MKRLMKSAMKLFSPKQDEYSELKTRLRNLEEELQHLINRNLVNSSRFLDLRRRYFSILEAKRKLPVQRQKKLQDRIDIFLEKYKEYRFEEPIERSKPDSAFNKSHIGNLEMHSTSYNFCHTSSPDKKQTSCQTSFYGKWEKPPNEQVLSSNEANRTPNEVLQSRDVEMKDVSERNQDVDVEVAKEVKSPPSRRSSLRREQKNEETVGVRRRSNEVTGNFQYNEENKEISFYGVSRKDGNTQTTPSHLRQPSNRTKLELEQQFQNLNTTSDVSSDARKQEANRNQHQIERMETFSKKSSFQPKQEESLKQKVDSNEHKTRNLSNQCRHYEETHFDTSLQQELGHRKSFESASSRIAKSVAHENKSPNEKCIQSRRSWGDHAAIYEQYRHQCEEEMGEVRIQIEETKIEKVEKFISEDKKKQKSQRYQQEQAETFSGGVLVLEKDGHRTIVRQQQPHSVGKEKGDQGAIENSVGRERQESPSKNDQNRSRDDLENKDQQDKNRETSQEIRGRGRLMSNRTLNESMARNCQDPVERRNCQQQYRRSPGVARPVYASDNKPQSYHSTQTNVEETHRRTEVAREAVKKEPLQILDVHKYFQDDFDLKSLDASIDATTQIETVRRWVETFEEKVSNFSEAKFSLGYFVLDEKLMRFIEHLDKLKCREDKAATQKKIEVIEYIKGLHETLDTRAVDE